MFCSRWHGFCNVIGMNKQRHTKSNPAVRCCWICGKVGGDGFTSALRSLGYDVPAQGVVAHAHSSCMAREAKKFKDANRHVK